VYPDFPKIKMPIKSGAVQILAQSRNLIASSLIPSPHASQDLENKQAEKLSPQHVPPNELEAKY
jgi:hypothetical protein